MLAAAVDANNSPRQRPESRKQERSPAARPPRARGIPDRHIASALEEVAQTSDEAAMVRQRIERKLRSYRGPDTRKKIDEKKMASMYGSLLRAGFSADVVRRELKALTREELPEVETE